MDLSAYPKDYYVKSMAFTQHTYQDVYPSIDPTTPALNLAGRVAMITGASRGVGAKGVIPSFIQAGVKGLVLLATNEKRLAEIEAEAKQASPKVVTLAIALDVSDAVAVDAAFNKVKDVFGYADVLVNCAGICSGDGPDVGEADPELWWRNFEVNGKGAFLLMRSFTRMLPSKDARATVIQMSSWQGFYDVSPMSGYFISKLIGDGLVTYAATQYPNITFVAVHPGLVETEMLREPFRSYFDLDSPMLVGGVAVWLCQDKARFLSGRFISTNWSVDELEARKDEILRDDLLKLRVRGQFGTAREV